MIRTEALNIILFLCIAGTAQAQDRRSENYSGRSFGASAAEADVSILAATPAAATQQPPVPTPESEQAQTSEPKKQEGESAADGEESDTATDERQVKNGTLKKLKEDIKQLRADVKQLKQENVSLRSTLQTQQSSIADNTESVTRLASLTEQNLSAIEKLQERAGGAESRLDDHDSRIRAAGEIARDNDEKLQSLAISDGSGGYMLDLSAKMERNAAFQQEVQETLQGKLRIHNESSSERRIHINGTAWRARPGWSYVWVPLGPVTIHRNADSTPETSDQWEFVTENGAGNWVIRYRF